MTFRFDRVTVQLIEEFASRLAGSKTEVIRWAMRELASQRGIEVSSPPVSAGKPKKRKG